MCLHVSSLLPFTWLILVLSKSIAQLLYKAVGFCRNHLDKLSLVAWSKPQTWLDWVCYLSLLSRSISKFSSPFFLGRTHRFGPRGEDHEQRRHWLRGLQGFRALPGPAQRHQDVGLQVWSLTQLYSVRFSQSRIGAYKVRFQQTHNEGLRQLLLTVSLDLGA